MLRQYSTMIDNLFVPFVSMEPGMVDASCPPCRFIDIDAFVMNPAFKLEWLLEVAEKQQQRQRGGMEDGWGELTPVRGLKVHAAVLF